MKDREPITMADRLPELEITPAEPEQFVAQGVGEVAGEMFRWSVGPATDIDRNLLLRNPAKALAQVPIEDPNLRFSQEELKNPSDETLSLAVPLVEAKAKVIEQELHLTPKEKGSLDNVVKKTVSVIGPKRAAVAIMALTTACSSVVGPDTPPNPVIEPTPTLAPSTQETAVAPFPTQEVIERPIANAFVLEGDALFGTNEVISGEFAKFESDFLAQHGGSMPENIRLTATGILTEYADGGDMTLHPFFSVESDNPEIPSVMNMLVAVPNDGGFEYKLMPLQRTEWEDDQGKIWITLSVTSDPRTDVALADALEVFAIPKDQLNNPDASVWWSPSGIALETTKSSTVKVLAALTVASQEAETAPTYQLEDGTQTERVTEGQLVELFPGSEVYMSERGDIVIINEETGIQLAGQEIETKYGRITILVGDSFYQGLVRSSFRRETSLGGYPDIASSPHREEIARIISSLLAIKEREITLERNLENYQPSPKNFIMIYMQPGNAIPLANSMSEGLIDPNDIRTISNYEVGYPTFETNDNTFLFIRFFGAVGQLPEDYPEDAKQLSLYSGLSYLITNPFYRLVLEAAVAQGYDHISFANNYPNKGFEGLMQSPFASLFKHQGIQTWMSQEREHISVTLERMKTAIPRVIEVDFANFK